MLCTALHGTVLYQEASSQPIMSSSQTRETTPTRVPAWLYPWYSSDNNDDSVRASTDLLIQLLVDVLRSIIVSVVLGRAS